MTREEELYYNNFFDLFGSDGWKQLIKELEEKEKGYDVSLINDVESLNFCKGELNVLRSLLNFETFIESAYDSIKTTSN